MALFDTPLSSFLQGAQTGLAANRRGRATEADPLSYMREDRLLREQQLGYVDRANALIDNMGGPDDVREVAEFLRWGEREFQGNVPDHLKTRNFLADYGGDIAPQGPPGPTSASLAPDAAVSTPADPKGQNIGEQFLPGPGERYSDGLDDLRARQAGRARYRREGYGSRKKYLDAAADELDFAQRMAVANLGSGVQTFSEQLTELAEAGNTTRAQILSDPEAFTRFALDHENYLTDAGLVPEEVKRQMDMLYDVRDNLAQGMTETEARATAEATRKRLELNMLNGVAANIVGARGSMNDGVFEIDLSGDPKKQRDYNLLASKIPEYMGLGLGVEEIQYAMLHDYGNRLDSVPLTTPEQIKKDVAIATAPQWVHDGWDVLPLDMKYRWVPAGGEVPEGLYGVSLSDGSVYQFTPEAIQGYRDIRNRIDNAEQTGEAVRETQKRAVKNTRRIGYIKSVTDSDPLGDPLGGAPLVPSPTGVGPEFSMPTPVPRAPGFAESVLKPAGENVMLGLDDTVGFADNLFSRARSVPGKAYNNFMNSLRR